MALIAHRTSQLVLSLAFVFVLPAFCQTAADPILKARSMLNEGRVRDSEALLRDYLKTNSSSPDAHFLLGYVLFRDQQAMDSLVEFTEGAKYRRPRADELKVVASDYVMLGDYSDADKWYSQVVLEKPEDADAWYLLGRTKFNENEYAAAISSFERALSLHPRYVEAENNIGLCWKELNNPDKAEASFKAAIEWLGSGPLDAQPFLNLGTLFADANKLDEATYYLTRADTLSPQNPTVHEQLGRVYLAQKKLPDAQGELEKAITLAPEVSSLHYKLAQIYRKEGMADRAKQEFAICEKLSSSHSSSKTPNPLSLSPGIDRPQHP